MGGRGRGPGHRRLEKGGKLDRSAIPRHGGPSRPQAGGPRAAPREGRAGQQARARGAARSYLCVLHQVTAALEAVVELGHPPGGDDLDIGQGVRPGGPCCWLSWPPSTGLASLFRGRRC